MSVHVQHECRHGHRWERKQTGAATHATTVCPRCGEPSTSTFETTAEPSSDAASVTRLHDELPPPPRSGDAGANRPVTTSDKVSSSEEPAQSRWSHTEEYQVLTEIGRGGMGIVYEARQESLGRHVALKVMPPGARGNDGRIQRFLLEAEVNSLLEHPGIVPVHVSGRDEQGQHFYTMRLVRGESFGDAIAKYHQEGERPGKTEERRVRFRQLLRRFLDACNAVAYAHSRGFLHRDLKPDNILLGPFGETLVVDWGLAKAIEGDEFDRPPQYNAVAVPDSEMLTHTGHLLGTPRFMSPEQASGDPDAVSVPSDVYGLGATLYTFLTGAPPVEGRDTNEVLRRVRTGEIVWPRTRNPKVPPGLDAICQKAMALDPAARYASAGALAEDIERWLADEPVSARPESRLARMGRWARRHRIAVSIATALMAATAVTSVVAAVLIGHAEGRTRAERDQARLEHDRAEENFLLAQQAVDQYFTRVSTDTLLNAPGTQALRKQLLEDALQYYENFVQRRHDVYQFRKPLAESHMRIGLITREIDRLGDARNSFQLAHELFQSLAATEPNRAENLRSLARSAAELGETDLQRQDYDAAESWLERARELLTELVAQDAADFESRHELVRVQMRRARLQDRLNRPDQSLRLYDEALDSVESLVAAEPQNALYLEDLADCLLSHGTLCRQLRRHGQSISELEDAIGLFERLATQYPQVDRYRFRGAFAQSQCATTLRVVGRFDEARRRFEVGITLLEQLAELNPHVHAYREELAGAFNNLGNLLRAMSKPDAALEVHRRALRLRERIYADNPEKLYERRSLISSINAIARIESETGRLDDAIATLESGKLLLSSVLASSPHDADAHHDLSIMHANLGHIKTLQANLDAAIEELLEAVRLLNWLRERDPEDEVVRQRLLLRWESLCEIYAAQTRGTPAVEAARQVRSLGIGRASDLYNAAWLLASCRGIAPDRAALEQEATAALREAIAAGLTAAMLCHPKRPAQQFADLPEANQLLMGPLDAVFPNRPFGR